MTRPDTMEQICPSKLDERYRRLRLERPDLKDAMVESLSRHGQLSPIIVTLRDEVFAVVDGFKRLDGARALGSAALLAQSVPMSEQAAVAAMYHYNRTSRGLDDLEQAMVVRALYREHGLTQIEISELLGHHKSWVCRRLALIERLSEEVQNDVRVGLTSVTVAREIARLPRGNQPEVSAAIAEHGLTTRQARHLVELFEIADGREEQRDLLARPREILEAHGRTDSGVVPDPRLGKIANRLRRLLLVLDYEQAAIRGVVARCKPTTWTDIEREIVAPLIERCADESADLSSTLDRLFETVTS